MCWPPSFSKTISKQSPTFRKQVNDKIFYIYCPLESKSKSLSLSLTNCSRAWTSPTHALSKKKKRSSQYELWPVVDDLRIEDHMLTTTRLIVKRECVFFYLCPNDINIRMIFIQNLFYWLLENTVWQFRTFL